MSSQMPPKNALIAVIIFTLGTSYRMGFGMSSFNPTEKVLTDFMGKILSERYNLKGDSLDHTGYWIWSLTTSIMFLSATFGAITVTFFFKHLRRNGLIVAQFIFIFGSLISAFSYFNAFELLIAGQFVTGFALGFGCSILTSYIDEISDSSHSHILYTLVALSIEFGTTTANFMGIDVLLGGEHTWPIVFAFPAIFNIICIIFLFHGQKETPVKLLKQDQRSEAIKSVCYYYQLQPDDAEKKLHLIEKSMTETGSQDQKSTWQALTNRKNRKALLLSVGTSTIANFSGILAITIYGTKLLSEYGKFSPTVSGFVNASVFMSSFFGLLLALFTVKNMSHKILLLIGLPAMLVINLGFMTVMLVKIEGIAALILIGLLVILFCLAFSNSVEKVMWFNGTMYTHPEYIDATSSITVAATYFTAFVAPFIYLPIQESIGPLAFLIFVVPLAIVWICFFIWYPLRRIRPTTTTDTPPTPLGHDDKRNGVNQAVPATETANSNV